MDMKQTIFVVIAIVIAIILVPTVWDATWVDAGGCFESNSTPVTTGTDCRGTAVDDTFASFCVRCLNGTTWTLVRLAPLIFVGLLVFSAVLLGTKFTL